MEAKDKALELVGKYKSLVYPYLGSGMLINQEDESVILSNSKTCALITVSEILKTAGKTSLYWEDVENEINKL